KCKIFDVPYRESQQNCAALKINLNLLNSASGNHLPTNGWAI
ncbi:MAG: hypothetical protein ACI9C3_002371, partial [Yoonia sp.]